MGCGRSLPTGEIPMGAGLGVIHRPPRASPGPVPVATPRSTAALRGEYERICPSTSAIFTRQERSIHSFAICFILLGRPTVTWAEVLWHGLRHV